MAGLIALMVTVGGATRLTDSGLSITEWDLVLGALPPLSAADWEAAFARYREIPEYTHVNAGMTMAAFKDIYWWEWGHRNLGRFIGLAFLLPLLWFAARGVVRGALRLRLFGLFLLVCLQGVVGWFMVASGLEERVDVSQYRLALHLSLAFLLFGLVVWQALALRHGRARVPVLEGQRRPLARHASLLIVLIGVQTILGAFVAGLRAGKSWNTWPLMDGRFFPADYFGTPPQIADAFERLAAVQFNHRLFAYVVVLAGMVYAARAWAAGGWTRQLGLTIGVACTGQAGLGIVTLVLGVPIGLGLAHQLGALALLGLAIAARFNLRAAAHVAA